MKFIRVKAVAKKEFIQIRRDTRLSILVFAIPITLLALFGYAITLDIRNLPTAILDYDKSQKSQDFIGSFKESKYFSLQYVNDYSELKDLLDAGKAKIGIIIPPDFAEKLSSQQEVPIQTILDGSDANTATIGMGYVSALSWFYSSKIILGKSNLAGQKLPLDSRLRIWYNSELRSQNFIIPGLIAVIMMIMGTVLTSLTVAREWERGTMEQLISTSISSRELLLGKLIPYFIIGWIDVLLTVVLGIFLFKVPFRGNLMLLFFTSSVFLFCALGIGLFISVSTKSQQLANQLALVTSLLPSYLLSGFIFPITSMPKFVQIITHLVPARFFIKIVLGIFLKGSGFTLVLSNTIILFFYGAGLMLLANLKFKKSL
jgi:ABC-2 type transport system permease protein